MAKLAGWTNLRKSTKGKFDQKDKNISILSKNVLSKSLDIKKLLRIWSKSMNQRYKKYDHSTQTNSINKLKIFKAKNKDMQILGKKQKQKSLTLSSRVNEPF